MGTGLTSGDRKKGEDTAWAALEPCGGSWNGGGDGSAPLLLGTPYRSPQPEEVLLLEGSAADGASQQASHTKGGAQGGREGSSALTRTSAARLVCAGSLIATVSIRGLRAGEVQACRLEERAPLGTPYRSPCKRRRMGQAERAEPVRTLESAMAAHLLYSEHHIVRHNPKRFSSSRRCKTASESYQGGGHRERGRALQRWRARARRRPASSSVDTARPPRGWCAPAA